MLSGCHQNNAGTMEGNIGIQSGCCLDVIRIMRDNVVQYQDTVRVCLDVIRIMQGQCCTISGYSPGAVWMSLE